MSMNFVVTKKIDGTNVYYTVRWSKFAKAEKYSIITGVPGMSGIFELYYQDKKKKLNLFRVQRAWFGGLRNAIRAVSDPLLETDVKIKDILENHVCYYRYSVLESYKDLADVLFFFSETYFPKRYAVESSGRFLKIFLQEISPEKIVTI
ncbi:MAG: hypothetical protein GXP33_16615, partial [Spirochaetes bacterium]|nr:hypothetical protein [Spirochaetota bacterium]